MHRAFLAGGCLLLLSAAAAAADRARRPRPAPGSVLLVDVPLHVQVTSPNSAGRPGEAVTRQVYISVFANETAEVALDRAIDELGLSGEARSGNIISSLRAVVADARASVEKEGEEEAWSPAAPPLESSDYATDTAEQSRDLRLIAVPFVARAWVPAAASAGEAATLAARGLLHGDDGRVDADFRRAVAMHLADTSCGHGTPPPPPQAPPRHSTPRPIPPIAVRHEIGHLLHREGAKSFVEVGVLRGEFAESVLRRWPSATHYVGIDPWREFASYNDLHSSNQRVQDANYALTHRRLISAFPDVRVELLRNTSEEAAPLLEDESYDFVYLDARHDYCAVAWELEAYWPKVRPGGIFGGDDFVDTFTTQHSGVGDWSWCADGSRHEGAVRAAVLAFAERHRLQLSIAYFDSTALSSERHRKGGRRFPSWFVRKPEAV